MTKAPSGERTPSGVVGARVREVRRLRDWTAAQLAERCADLGAPEITSSVVTDLETGRRDKTTGRRRRNITVDELLVLALALDVAPVHLIAPTYPAPGWGRQDGRNDPNDAQLYAVTSTQEVPVYRVRSWVRGERPLPGTDARLYFTQIPSHEFDGLLEERIANAEADSAR